jgi:hypothetical protein
VAGQHDRMTGELNVADDPWQADVTTYRGSYFRLLPPWGYVLGVVWLGLVVVRISEWFNQLLLLIVAVMFTRAWWLTRSTSMKVSRAGVERTNAGRRYVVRIPWEDVQGIERSRFRFGRLWALEYAPQDLLPIGSSSEVPPRSLKRARRLGMERRFPLGPFLRDPLSSPFADRLFEMRPDLAEVSGG